MHIAFRLLPGALPPPPSPPIIVGVSRARRPPVSVVMDAGRVAAYADADRARDRRAQPRPRRRRLRRHPHARRATSRARLAAQVTGIDRRRVAVGTLDITLYRDDLMRHAVGPQPVVRRTDIPFSIDDRRILLVDDVLYTGRTIRAALDALIDFGRPTSDPARRARRPRPSRAADQGRLRRQEPADVAAAERPGAARGRSTAATRWSSRRASR